MSQVFISSTFTDLESYRKSVINTLQQLRTDFFAMEFFCACSEPPKQVCLAEVEKSDILILILGMRYGSVDEATKKSFTQLEYEAARKKGRDVLAFLIDERKQAVLPGNVDRDEDASELIKFKEKVKKDVYFDTFTTEDDLAKKVAIAMYRLLSKRIFTMKPDPVRKGAYIRPRTSWKGYSGLYHLDQYYAAYIPIINAPSHKYRVAELTYDDISVHLDSQPYTLPEEFQTEKTYDAHNGKSCRLSNFSLDGGTLDLLLSETSYWDYLKSGEHLDMPYPRDPKLTYRDVFGKGFSDNAAGFALFNLTNICGCGLFILTSDKKLLITKHPESSSVYPGRLTYSASGTLRFADYPNPFTEMLYKAQQEINHQIDLKNLRMIGFGADARKLYFQFSFVETVRQNYTEFSINHKNLQPVDFHPEAVVDCLVSNLWEPAAEATMLTLLIREYGYKTVVQTLTKYRRFWGRRDIKDEWDYRAACGGIASTLSIRYPAQSVADISRRYIDHLLKFMGADVKGKDILEVGSGDGRVTRHLLLSGAAHVTCVDICERMIHKSKEALQSYQDRITYHTMFAQDYHQEIQHDVAVLSLVLIHNIDDTDFRKLIETICQNARVIYVFEDITINRSVSPYTKLRPESEIIDTFALYKRKPVKRLPYQLYEDQIVFLQFSPDGE